MNSYTEKSNVFASNQYASDTLIPPTGYRTTYHPSRLGGIFARLGNHIMHWLTTGSMPRISKQMVGESEIWKMYDPVSRQTAYFDDENALRIWMENRYYQ